ncbi:hypothetical protein GS605_19175 [Ruegeria sp. HKCCD7559]|nr:hypothetical protein [Ruegeria sp. HKCCD7559]
MGVCRNGEQECIWACYFSGKRRATRFSCGRFGCGAEPAADGLNPRGKGYSRGTDQGSVVP